MTEPFVDWRKSQRCGDQACVEVAQLGQDVILRDSKDREGPVLRFTRAEWDAFVEGVEAGDFAFG
ncbi:DUF397 domain-containing protein [Catellatospora sp. NPDC049133]|uniref:DUF397 domain-containing protein n=1 Tax=Catellatospora sp. NPDC049133 TaxID=3155499 RepID=UPI0033FEC524